MLLHHIFWDRCITVPLEFLDQAVQTKAKKGKGGVSKSQVKAEAGALKNRTLLCGALMDALVVAAGGDDSILASSSAYEMLCRPFKVLKLDKADREDRLGAAILAGTDTRINDLIQELQLYLTQNNLVVKGLTEISLLISQQIQARTSKTFSTPLPQNPPIPSDRPATKNLGKHDEPSTQKPKPRPQSASKLETTSCTTPINSLVSFAYIALILREACNRGRSLPPANEALFNALCGVNSNGRQILQPEQMDPIRAKSAYATLMKNHIPPHKLTSHSGISAILTYMLSGQSSPTRDFLETNRGCLFDHNTCFQSFKSVVEHNRVTFDNNEEVKRKKAAGKKLPTHVHGQINFQNPWVWGQTCPALMIDKANEPGFLSKRLDHLFSNKIQTAWTEWLGDLVGRDPAEILPEQQRPWADAYGFVRGLNVNGMMSGLTPMQFTNSLCIAGLVLEPTQEDMTRFIWWHKDLGAFRGLELLGFKKFADEQSLAAAFSYVYKFLNTHLTNEDKDILHFGVMFVEHLLCKVSWWNKQVAGGLGEYALEVGDWERGANILDGMEFPVPAYGNLPVASTGV